MSKSAIASALARKATTPSVTSDNPQPMVAHPAPMAPAGGIEGNFPAGVYNESVSQAMAPFMGGHQLPTGQTINVSMNAPSPHLSFKEWAGRGIVSAIGAGLRWPFRLITGIIEDIARMLVNLLGKLVLFVLLPTMLIIGLKMASQISNAPSVEAGAAQIVHHGRHAANGVVTGMTDELPPEEKVKPKDRKAREAGGE